MINKIHDIVLNDLKVKVREIAEIASISIERLVNILHTHLCMRKFCARWVPRFLTIDQKRIRVTTSEQNLAYCNRDPKELSLSIVVLIESVGIYEIYQFFLRPKKHGVGILTVLSQLVTT